ncbi:hypothetical protein V8E53_010388 [Lactarius tabidus]
MTNLFVNERRLLPTLTYSSTRPPPLASPHRTIRVRRQYCFQARMPRASTTDRERSVRRSVNYAEPKPNTLRDHPTQVKCASSGGSQAPTDNNIAIVSERRRKWVRLRLPVDDKESDIAQSDEESLAGSRVRTTGLANVNTQRRSAVVSASRRS